MAGDRLLEVRMFKSFMRRAGGEVLPTGASLEVTSRLRNKVPQTFRFDDTVRLVVIENPHANVPLPDRRSNLQLVLMGLT